MSSPEKWVRRSRRRSKKVDRLVETHWGLTADREYQSALKASRDQAEDLDEEFKNLPKEDDDLLQMDDAGGPYDDFSRVLTRTELQRMKVKALRDLCLARGIDVKPRALKRTLVAALLLSNDNEEEEEEEEEDSGAGARTDAAESWWQAYVPGTSTGDITFNRACFIAVFLVLVCLIAENVASTPYGKFGGEGGMIPLDGRVGWWLMELPCSTVFFYLFWLRGGPQASKPVPRLLAVVFTLHYAYRGWIFPFLLKPGAKNFDAVVASSAWMVTITHAYLNARWFSKNGKHLSEPNATTRPALWLGLVIYYGGLAMTAYHDYVLRNLRPCPDPKEQYCIPHGGLFSSTTNAQYFTELTMWAGFALAVRGPNGYFILAVSLSNLIPRSIANHEWYLKKFPDYAGLQRNILIPGVW